MSDSDSGESQSGVTTRRPKKMRRSTDHQRSVMPSDTLTYNVKVPSFSPEDPEIWFAVLESQFENYGIEDDAVKFNNVVTKLGIAHAKAVKDIILNPPAQNRYDRIKGELIKRLTASHEKKVRQLLSHEEIGDRKASDFLRHLRDLAGPNVPEDFLRTIWSNRLPHSIQTVLASQSSQNLEQLADLADRVQEISSPGNVAAASAPNSASSTSTEIAELRKMVERLAVKLDEHTRESRSHQHTQSTQPRRRHSECRSRTRSSSSYRQYPICWYHTTYKSQSRKCQAPCNFKNRKTPRAIIYNGDGRLLQHP